MPPRPSELTAASRGRSPAGQSRHCVLTKNGLAAKSIFGLGLRKLRLGGIFPFFNAKRSLDQSGEPGRLLQVPDVGLHRADRAEAVPLRSGAERAGQCVDLQRITDDRAGSMALDIGDVVRRHVGYLHSLDHRARLARDARGRVAHLVGAIIVDRRSSDDRVDVIAVGDGGGEILEQDRADTAAENRALRVGIEGTAMSVGRQDAAFHAGIADALGHAHGGGARQRHVAFARENRLAGEMHGDQRRRAGGLHVDAWSGQIELVGNSSARKILVVAEVREGARIARQVRAERQPIDKIAGHHPAQSGENADRLGRASDAAARRPRRPPTPPPEAAAAADP